VVLVVIVLVTLLRLPPSASQALFSGFLLIGLWEWSGFFASGQILLRIFYTSTLAAVGVWALVSGVIGSYTYPVLWVGLIWWLLFGISLFLRTPEFPRWFTLLAGIFCIAPAWIALQSLLGDPLDAALFIWLIAMVAAADIGAYFAGKRWGSRKLAPQLSPGKTVEGLLGGLFCSAVIGAAGAALGGYHPVWFVVLASLVAIVSVIGDLSVSAFKRNAGLKDSGSVLPGHGGVLDRIDGLIAAAPIYSLIVSMLA
jgi:phosphatidate cytidylyltransferase